MSKKFVFNKEKLQYDEQRVSFKEILGKAVLYILISLVIAVLYYAVFSVFFSTGKEKRLEQENAYIKNEVQNMEEKVALVDDVLKDLDIRDKVIYNDIFNSDPPKADYYLAEDTLSNVESLYDASESDLIHNTMNQCSEAEKKVSTVKKEINLIMSQITSDDFVPSEFPSIIPLKNFTIAQTGASVGMKIHPYYKTLVKHTGIDLVAPLGTDIFATADGTVTKVERLKKGFGNSVTLDHGNGIVTFYAHMGDIYVRAGQRVKQGLIIGRVGNSGTVFASSLHYEVRRNGEFMDPINYFFASISPAVYTRMMQIASNTGQTLD